MTWRLQTERLLARSDGWSSPDEVIEAAQKRALERTRRPILAADIAHFGEDETVIMRRKGGWIRVYRAHHKADTMTTVGHIAKAMRDIDAKGEQERLSAGDRRCSRCWRWLGRPAGRA